MKIGAFLRITAVAVGAAAILAGCAAGSPTPAASIGDKNAVLDYWLWQDNATDTTWAQLA
jgi:multiple sugar transport system substrate-binding protein